MSPSHFLEAQCYHYSSNSVLERRGGCLGKAGGVSQKGGGMSWHFVASPLLFKGPFVCYIINLSHLTTITHRDSHYHAQKSYEISSAYEVWNPTNGITTCLLPKKKKDRNSNSRNQMLLIIIFINKNANFEYVQNSCKFIILQEFISRILF